MKFKSYVIFFLLFGVLADTVLCCDAFRDAPLAVRCALCLPTLVVLVTLPLIGAGVRYTDSVRVFSYLTFIFEFPKFILALTWLVARYLCGASTVTAGRIGLVAGGAVSAFFLTLIFYVTRHLKVSERTFSFRDLPAGFDGLRICQLSDFHLGSFGQGCRYIRRIIDTAMALQPEVILFTGDLVNFEAAEAEPFLEDLGRLQAPLGIYAIRGNHDYLLHGHPDETRRREDREKLLGLERSLGWHLLLNDHALLRRGSDEIALVGVENTSANPLFSGGMGGDLKKALEGLPEGIFKILLSHDPTHWRAGVLPESDIPLTLSGHTHGLRYKLAGLHVSHWRLRESAGVYAEGDRLLHVSEGLGSAFAFRLGGFPRVNLLTLKQLKPTSI